MKGDRVQNGHEKSEEETIRRWGLSEGSAQEIGERLAGFWGIYGRWARTKTRDNSAYGLAYVSGLLRMEEKRNMANIGRKTGVSGQNLQHFMSESPWAGREMIAAMQEAVCQRPEMAGGMLIIDESGEEKSGASGAGVIQQYNGRHRNLDTSQVGVFSAYVKGDIWTWVDGELFIPKPWFSEGHAQRRKKAGMPQAGVYHTKTELGWELIQRARAAGLPFVAVAFDSLYGMDTRLRDRCRRAGIEYYADIRRNTQVYLKDPSQEFIPRKDGRVPKRPGSLSKFAWGAGEVADLPDTHWQRLSLRPDARGILAADFAARPVWTLRDDGEIVPETLLIRRDKDKLTFTLTNAPANTSLTLLAQRKSQRYFVERSIQDAKSEFGWDEFQALKFRAWEHHLALTILASWFIAETRLDWSLQHPHDPALFDQYATDVLPILSVANVRELLRAALPLPQLSPHDATRLVVQHFENRARSRRSRLKNRSASLI